MAIPSVTYTFSDGTGNVIRSAEMNTNFQDVIDGVSDGLKDINVNDVSIQGSILNALVCDSSASITGPVIMSADATIAGDMAMTGNLKKIKFGTVGLASIGSTPGAGTQTVNIIGTTVTNTAGDSTFQVTGSNVNYTGGNPLILSGDATVLGNLHVDGNVRGDTTFANAITLTGAVTDNHIKFGTGGLAHINSTPGAGTQTVNIVGTTITNTAGDSTVQVTGSNFNFTGGNPIICSGDSTVLGNMYVANAKKMHFGDDGLAYISNAAGAVTHTMNINATTMTIMAGDSTFQVSGSSVNISGGKPFICGADFTGTMGFKLTNLPTSEPATSGMVWRDGTDLKIK